MIYSVCLPSSLPPAAARRSVETIPTQSVLLLPPFLPPGSTDLQEVVGRPPCYVRLASARRGIELEAERENDAIRER